MSAYLTVLSHSGGEQSHVLLEMVLRGDLEKPFRFLVLNSDPGMEDSRTYTFVRESRRRCREAGIDYITAPGPSLYTDIINLPSTGARRLDNPPFWVKKPDGKRGRLTQGCTQHYKIAPMRAALRKYLATKHGVTNGVLRPGLIDMWIGFAVDEKHRCSESDVAYIRNTFPLIERGMTRHEVGRYYDENGIERPPRSVCRACFSNGLAYYKAMYEERFTDRIGDWETAVEVDNAVEHWHELGITEYPVFVSPSLIRLRDLPAINFGLDREELKEHRCNSGVCFL